MIRVRFQQLRARAARRDGGLAILTLFFVAACVLTFIPALYSVGLLTNENARLTLYSEAAAYSSSTILDQTGAANHLTIDSASAKAHARDELATNLRTMPGNWTSTIQVHNPAVSLADSLTADPGCTSGNGGDEGAACWADEVFGAFHRTPGVSVTIVANVQVCGTWSPILLGGRNCFVQRITTHGYAEYAAQTITDADAITFAISGPDAQTTATSADMTWSISGPAQMGTSECLLDGSVYPCASDSLGSGDFTHAVGAGSHSFQIRVRGTDGQLHTSQTYRWKVGATGDRSIAIEWVDRSYDPDGGGYAHFEWEVVGTATYDPAHSECELATTPAGGATTYQPVPCDLHNEVLLTTADLQPDTTYVLIIVARGTNGEQIRSTATLQTHVLRHWGVVPSSTISRIGATANAAINLDMVDSSNLFNVDFPLVSCSFTAQNADVPGAPVTEVWHSRQIFPAGSTVPTDTDCMPEGAPSSPRHFTDTFRGLVPNTRYTFTATVPSEDYVSATGSSSFIFRNYGLDVGVNAVPLAANGAGITNLNIGSSPTFHWNVTGGGGWTVNSALSNCTRTMWVYNTAGTLVASTATTPNPLVTTHSSCGMAEGASAGPFALAEGALNTTRRVYQWKLDVAVNHDGGDVTHLTYTSPQWNP